VSVESDVVLAKHVVDDDLAGRAARPERRQHRTSWRGKELAHRLDQTAAVAHHASDSEWLSAVAAPPCSAPWAYHEMAVVDWEID
jgi:hypothetical protein